MNLANPCCIRNKITIPASSCLTFFLFRVILPSLSVLPVFKTDNENAGIHWVFISDPGFNLLLKVDKNSHENSGCDWYFLIPLYPFSLLQCCWLCCGSEAKNSGWFGKTKDKKMSAENLQIKIRLFLNIFHWKWKNRLDFPECRSIVGI